MGGCGEPLKFQISSCTSFMACVFQGLCLSLQGSAQIVGVRGGLDCEKWLWAIAETTSTANSAPKAPSALLELIGGQVHG